MTKLLGAFASPSGLAYLLFAAGLIVALSVRWRRVSWLLLASSGAIHLIFSSGMAAAALMSPLEYAYPTVHEPQRFPDVTRIVVLTGWAGADPDMPLTGRFGVSTAYRVLHALELYEERPDCSVIVSGDAETAHIMGQALVKLGVPAEKVQLEDRSPTTADSVANLPAFVGDEPFFLVTSAGHLPRTMAAMEREGLRAIPAPTDHQLPKDWRRAEWNPTPSSLMVSDRAIHEYLGRAWYAVRARL